MAKRVESDPDYIFNEIADAYEPLPLQPAFNREGVGLKDLDLSVYYKTFFQQVIDYVEDPQGLFGPRVTKKDLINWLTNSIKRRPIIGISEHEDLSEKMKRKDAKFDRIVENFVLGVGGGMSRWDEVYNDTKTPIALRSIAKKQVMKTCEEQGRDYYYIDTGYFGNVRLKDYHRITKNAMQYLGLIEDRPDDRLQRCNIKISKMTSGSKILLCPPSEKAMGFWELDLDTWLADTISAIQQHTDREIVVRKKSPRNVRMNVDTMEYALSQDIHCMVTFNSIAAIESLINGKPVFTLGPNAAHHLSNHDLKDIETPYRPEKDQVRQLLSCLAYHQFTIPEMRSGYAWAVLNGEA